MNRCRTATTDGPVRQKEQTDTMLTRSTTTALARRSSTMRRLRRRSQTAHGGQLYCRTNGCASFLDLDPSTGIARCHVCGFERSVAH